MDAMLSPPEKEITVNLVGYACWQLVENIGMAASTLVSRFKIVHRNVRDEIASQSVTTMGRTFQAREVS